MAKSYAASTGDGVTNQFTVPFAYMDKSHVGVIVNGAAASFSWVNDSLIQITPTPTTGAHVVRSRVTPTTPLTAYPTSSILRGADLTRALTQSLYISEELEDRQDRSLESPDYEPSKDMTLPADRATKLLAFDINGAPVSSSRTLSDFESYIESLEVAQDAAAAAAQSATDAELSAASAGADLWARPVDDFLPAEPGSPAIGYRVLLDETNATHPNQIAQYFLGGWHYSGTASQGQRVFVKSSLTEVLFNGTVFGFPSPTLVNSPYYIKGGRPNDDTFDNSTAINAALVYAASQGRILKVDSVYYTGAGANGVKLQSFSMIEGNGYASGFAVMPGAAAGDHVAYYDPTTCIGTTVMNLGLDGRKTHGVTNIIRGLANFAAAGPATLGHPGHRYDSIYIRNYTGVGQSVGFAQRSSLFTNFTIYGCDSYGLNDSSADCILSNYDIGQCWNDTNLASNPAGWICSAGGGQRSNFKVWGTGQYGGTLAVPGIFIRNATDISFSNIWTQESGGPGLSVFGSGQTVPGLSFANFTSDSDGIVANQAAIILNNTEGLHLIGRVGKWSGTLAGTPQDGISIIANVTGSFIRLHSKGVSRRSLTVASGAKGNDISIDGNINKTLDHAYAASFTPEWYDAATHSMTLTGTTVVGVPTQNPDGATLTFVFTNGAGAAAPTWNAAYVPPSTWAAGFVATAGKINTVVFKRNDALGKWVAVSASYGM